MASPIRLRRKPPRERILAAAGRLFAERGAEAVTMSEVASEAGVARATVFNHFGTKHALIEGITETVLVYYQRLLDGAVADRETPTPDLVRRLFDIMARGIEEQRAFHRRVFREIANITLGLDEGGPGHRARQAHLESMSRLMRRGQQRGELTSEHSVDDLASAFGALIHGTITHWLYEDAAESLPERMARAAEVFLDGAKAP